MQQNFILGKWSIWPPLNDKGVTQAELLSAIPKMLKRRLSPLARIVFCAAIPCLEEHSKIPTVFSSTHGELAKSFKMMQMIEAGEEISPTAFSLSVHNAIAGLFAMAYENKVQSTVVAPGEEGIAAAFIEAMGLLDEGEKQVLIILYDEPLVSFYPDKPYKLTTNKSCAVALTISKTGSGTPMCFSYQNNSGDDGEQAIQLPLLIDFLANQQDSLLLHSPRHSWCWEKLQH
ncbi:MAG: beta-ketoacyl synthase chain length factor [Methylococcales bacterium]